MAVLTTPVLNHRFKNVTQCSRTKKTGDCLLCRRRHCEKSAGWRGRRRQGKWGVCTCLFCLTDCPSPPHISLLLCALVHYFALYRARQVWSCSWICNVLEQVQWLTCESQQVQSNCLRGVCTTQGCTVTQFYCLRELLYLLPGREKRAPPPASLTNDSWLRHSVQLIYTIMKQSASDHKRRLLSSLIFVWEVDTPTISVCNVHPLVIPLDSCHSSSSQDF